MNAMKHMVQELLLATHGRTAVEPLTPESYEQWCQSYLFDAIRDLRFGQAFCNHFGITDNFLFYERDIERAKQRIQKHYLK